MTKHSIALFAALTGVLLFAGCDDRTPQTTVVIIDTSLSITPRALRSAFDAVQNQIATLQRGDRLILIPITGDALNDTQGRILRLTAPTCREAYDADMRRFAVQSKKQFAEWAASLTPHQKRTDILGTLDIVRQEFAAIPKGTGRLVIVSDFLEDDSSYNFVTSPKFTTVGHANGFAFVLRAERHFSLWGVPICLGRLESTDFAALSPERREAIQAFWMEYLAEKDRAPELHFDGTGMLANGDGCATRPQHAASN
jgi:hypothetical protein